MRTSFMLFSTVRHCTDCEIWRVDGKTSQKASARRKARVRALKTATESANGYSCNAHQHTAHVECTKRRRTSNVSRGRCRNCRLDGGQPVYDWTRSSIMQAAQ